jgi:hypothetical protein
VRDNSNKLKRLGTKGRLNTLHGDLKDISQTRDSWGYRHHEFLPQELQYCILKACNTKAVCKVTQEKKYVGVVACPEAWNMLKLGIVWQDLHSLHIICPYVSCTLYPLFEGSQMCIEKIFLPCDFILATVYRSDMN